MFIYIYCIYILYIYIIYTNNNTNSILYNKYLYYIFILFFFTFSGLPPFSIFFFKILFFYKLYYINNTILCLFLFFINTYIIYLYYNTLQFFFYKTYIFKKKYIKFIHNKYKFNLYMLIFIYIYINLLLFFIFIMITKQKTFKKVNIFRKHRVKTRVLRKHPQKLGFVDSVRITTPRKPNSAKRKTVRIIYYHFIKKSMTYVPGGSHNLKKNSKVLVSGTGPRDTPGVYTHCIRGKCDLLPPLYKTKRRSIYGISRKNTI